MDEAYREVILLLETWDPRTRARFPLPSGFTAHSAEHFAYWALVTVPPNQRGLGVGAYGHLTGNAWAWVWRLASCHWGRCDIKFVLTASLNGVTRGLASCIWALCPGEEQMGGWGREMEKSQSMGQLSPCPCKWDSPLGGFGDLSAVSSCLSNQLFLLSSFQREACIYCSPKLKVIKVALLQSAREFWRSL